MSHEKFAIGCALFALLIVASKKKKRKQRNEKKKKKKNKNSPLTSRRPHIFKSILAHGHVMSLEFMSGLSRPAYAAHEARHHPLVQQIIASKKMPDIADIIERFVECLVLVHFSKNSKDYAAQQQEWEEDLKIASKSINIIVKPEEQQQLRQTAIAIAEAAILLSKSPMGIGYDVDKVLGTNKQVFSILGPHTGGHYGDIIFLFKQELMFHP
jgi:hypothetical protein